MINMLFLLCSLVRATERARFATEILKQLIFVAFRLLLAVLYTGKQLYTQPGFIFSVTD